MVCIRGRPCGSTKESRVWIGLVGLDSTGFRVVKLFDFVVTGISPLNVETIKDDSAPGGCWGDLLEGSVGLLGLRMGERIKLPDPCLEVS